MKFRGDRKHRPERRKEMTTVVAAVYGRPARRGMIAAVRIPTGRRQANRTVSDCFLGEVSEILAEHGRK